METKTTFLTRVAFATNHIRFTPTSTIILASANTSFRVAVVYMGTFNVTAALYAETSKRVLIETERTFVAAPALVAFFTPALAVY